MTQSPARQRAQQAAFAFDAWRRYAACSDLDPSLFFPDDTTDQVDEAGQEATEAAKQVCAGCPVRRACLSFAIATNQQYGVWGGHDELTRRRLRRRWRAGVEPSPAAPERWPRGRSSELA